MSNIHGLDFLRSEHILDSDGRGEKASDGVSTKQNDLDSANRTQAWVGPDLETLAAQVANKPALEKQFDVIHFLQAHRSSGCLAPSVIYQRTGIDLQEDEAVAHMLQHNPKIRVELVPDPENPSLMIATYAYQAKYNQVRDHSTLLAQINRCKNGVPRRDLEDAYDGVERDLDLLIAAGDVLAINNTEDKTQILFPRGEAFLVELDGIISVAPDRLKPPPVVPVKEEMEEDPKVKSEKDTEQLDSVKKEENSPTEETTKKETKESEGLKQEDPADKSVPKVENNDTVTANAIDEQNGSAVELSTLKAPELYIVDTDIDPRTQIRRGEAVQVGGQWFRVSSAVKEGTLKEQPARAQAPLSVVMLQDLSKRNEQDGYIRKISEKQLPVDCNLSSSTLENLQKSRTARERLLKVAHGRSGGVASQLLGSHAHAYNPTTLAASFGSASMAGSRKRPHKSSARDARKEQQAQKDNAIQAKEAATDPFLSLYSHARRHGCTKDVREMYLATRALVPDSDAKMKQMLLEHKLLEPGEEMRRPRLKRKSNVDNDGKPKKRRYYERKNQRMTNTHLEGTEIGAVLRRAQEKQKQGETVGDGGM